MTWSIHKAATELGVSRETIIRGLRRMELEVGAKTTFTTKQIFSAISGDLKFERTRRERAEADKSEIEAAVAKKTHMKFEDVSSVISNFCAKLREKAIAVPSQYAAHCNPSDPEHARQHLDRLRDDLLKIRPEIAVVEKTKDASDPS